MSEEYRNHQNIPPFPHSPQPPHPQNYYPSQPPHPPNWGSSRPPRSTKKIVLGVLSIILGTLFAFLFLFSLIFSIVNMNLEEYSQRVNGVVTKVSTKTTDGTVCKIGGCENYHNDSCYPDVSYRVDGKSYTYEQGAGGESIYFSPCEFEVGSIIGVAYVTDHPEKATLYRLGHVEEIRQKSVIPYAASALFLGLTVLCVACAVYSFKKPKPRTVG